MKLLKSVICLIAAVSSTSGTCYNSSSHQFCVPDIEANWLKAAEHCNQQGLRFAVVDTQAKQSELIDLANSLRRTKVIRQQLWIGASELAEHGKYVWLATGERMQYSPWKQGEPNNLNNKEHCAELFNIDDDKNSNWPWNDVNCNNEQYFVCEMKPSQ